MKPVTIWIKPTKDGNYRRIVEIENSAGTYIESDEKISATKGLQKILEKAERKNLSHEDGSYIVSDIERELDVDARKVQNKIEEAKAVIQTKKGTEESVKEMLDELEKKKIDKEV